jgi:hypothetical protein
MQNSKLIQGLKKLNTREFRRFSEFVDSPFYNKNKNVRVLMESLTKYYPKFENDDLTEDTIYMEVFPGCSFDYFKIRNLLSELFQLYKKYLKIISYEKKPIEAEINLLNELHERGLDVAYRQSDKVVQRYLDKSKVKDEEFYFIKHNLDRINTAHYKFEKSKYTFDSIQTEFDSFLQYSLTGLLHHYSKMLHNRNHGNINYRMDMFEEVHEYIKGKDFDYSPSCQIYKQIILVELNRDEGDYRKLQALKGKYSDQISKEDLYNVLLVINSFAVHRLQLGDVRYYKDRFLSLKEIIEHKFFADAILFPNFITTFTAACMANDYKWAAQFIESYKNGITPKEELFNTLTYCEAFLAYRKGDFEKALELFAKTNFKLFLFKVMVRSYMIRIYYEKNMHEQILNAVDAFRHYLKSEKLISDEQKEVHYEFLKYISLLSNIKLEHNKKSRDEALMMAEKSIHQMKSNMMSVKNWLLEKVKQLRGA